MSWGAVAVGAATVVAGVMTADQKAAADARANRTNESIARDTTAEGARQFDISQLESERRYGLDTARQENMFNQAQSLEGQRYNQEQVTGGQRYGDVYGSGGINQSIRDYSGQQLGGYNQAGQQATKMQQALLGMGTPQEQAAAQNAVQESPGQKFIRQRAQKALLANQAAIGGLGGGNVRSALVEQGAGFAAQDLDNQYARLSALSGQGLSAGQTMVGKDQGVISTEREAANNATMEQARADAQAAREQARADAQAAREAAPAAREAAPAGSTAANRGALTEQKATQDAKDEEKRQQDLRAGEGFAAQYAAAEKARKAEEARKAAEYRARMSEFG